MRLHRQLRAQSSTSSSEKEISIRAIKLKASDESLSEAYHAAAASSDTKTLLHRRDSSKTDYGALMQSLRDLNHASIARLAKLRDCVDNHEFEEPSAVVVELVDWDQVLP